MPLKFSFKKSYSKLILDLVLSFLLFYSWILSNKVLIFGLYKRPAVTLRNFEKVWFISLSLIYTLASYPPSNQVLNSFYYEFFSLTNTLRPFLMFTNSYFILANFYLKFITLCFFIL